MRYFQVTNEATRAGVSGMVLGIVWSVISSIPGSDPFFSNEPRNLYRVARFFFKSIISAAIMYILCSELRIFTQFLESKDATSILLVLDGASSNIIGAMALFLRNDVNDGVIDLNSMDTPLSKISQLRQLVINSGSADPDTKPSSTSTQPSSTPQSKDITYGPNAV